MNKNELIASISNETGLTKTDSAKDLEPVAEKIFKANTKGKYHSF